MKEVKVAINKNGNTCYQFNSLWCGFAGIIHSEARAKKVAMGGFFPFDEFMVKALGLHDAKIIHIYMVDDDGL